MHPNRLYFTFLLLSLQYVAVISFSSLLSSTLDLNSIAGCTSGVVVQKSHVDRVSSQLIDKGHNVRATLQVGKQRILMVQPNSDSNSDICNDVVEDEYVSQVSLPLSLDCATIYPSISSASLALSEKLSNLHSAVNAAPLKVRVSATPPSILPELISSLDSLSSDNLLSSSFVLSPRSPSYILCCLKITNTSYLIGVTSQTKISMGLSLGPSLTPSTSPKISRSYYKLSEAFDRYVPSILPGQRCIDLGASPGGWTEYLTEIGLNVTSVDPGELDRRVKYKCQHVRLTYQKYLEEVSGGRAEGGFEVFTCDMCLHEAGSAVSAFFEFVEAGVLEEGCLVVIAVKVNTRGKSTEGRDEIVKKYTKRVEGFLDGMRVFHLMTSKERERTIVGRYNGKSIIRNIT